MAGAWAHAAHAGAVVFADASSVAARSTASNQFLVQHADARKPGGGMWVAPADRRTMAGWLTRTSTRPTLNRRIESARRYEHSP